MRSPSARSYKLSLIPYLRLLCAASADILHTKFSCKSPDSHIILHETSRSKATPQRVLLQLGNTMTSLAGRAPPTSIPHIGEDGDCVNVQDNYPPTVWQGLWRCEQSVRQGLFNSTCRHELLLMDCDRECGLCACSTARGLQREHCSGNGYCSADCDEFGCKNARCICHGSWKGPKCEHGGEPNRETKREADLPRKEARRSRRSKASMQFLTGAHAGGTHRTVEQIDL